MPTTYLQSRLPSFNTGSKVGQLVLRGTNPTNPQTAVYLGVYSNSSFFTSKQQTTSTYNFEILVGYSGYTTYHFQTTGTNACQLLTVGIKAIGDIRIDVLPVDGDTIVVNSGSVGKTYRFKNTLAAVNDVKIGATIIATALSLASAIMLNGTAGTDYYATTTIHPIFTAVAYGAVVVLTDKIGCLRANGYTLTASSGARFSTRTPSGGVDGILLAETNGTTITEFRDTETYMPKKANSDTVLVASDYNYAPNFYLELRAEIPQTKSILVFGPEVDGLFGDVIIDYSYDNVNWFNYSVITNDFHYKVVVDISYVNYIKITFIFEYDPPEEDSYPLSVLAAYIIST